MSYNWIIAVVLAALAFFALGGVWYAVLFGKPWHKEMGITDDQAQAGSLIMMQFVWSITDQPRHRVHVVRSQGRHRHRCGHRRRSHGSEQCLREQDTAVLRHQRSVCRHRSRHHGHGHRRRTGLRTAPLTCMADSR
ncbi:MAG: DUF1761 domain-containing protein [Kineosporiaceae bacterium]|nr:DUF1761 domain-containing protein [Aeromicrobium sp.]